MTLSIITTIEDYAYFAIFGDGHFKMFSDVGAADA